MTWNNPRKVIYDCHCLLKERGLTRGSDCLAHSERM